MKKRHQGQPAKTTVTVMHYLLRAIKPTIPKGGPLLEKQLAHVHQYNIRKQRARMHETFRHEQNLEQSKTAPSNVVPRKRETDT